MSRYIDAEKLKESVEGLQDCYNGFSDTYDKSCIIGLIDEEPTADVVPVVRCQNCKHHPINGDGYCPAREISMLLSDDEFCSYGEVTE